MPQQPLSDETKQQIWDLKKNTKLTLLAIARETGVSLGSVSNTLADSGDKRRKDPIEDFAAYNKERFEHLLDRYRKWVGDTSKQPTPPKIKAGKRIKALGLNDIHAPFHHEEKFIEAVKRNRDADECWLVGDVLDLFNFARYDKYTRPFSPVEEFQSGHAILRTLSETFPKVRVLGGNHDARFIKYLVRDKKVDPQIIEFFEMMCPGFSSPLAKICSIYKNVEVFEPKKIDFATYGYIHQIGDCVLSHAEKYSSVPGKTPGDVLRRVQEKLVPMGIVSRDFKVLAQAHTHAAGKVWGDYGVVTIEMGCLARVPDYDGDAAIRGRMPIHGYTVFVQENGVTDRNASNFVELV